MLLNIDVVAAESIAAKLSANGLLLSPIEGSTVHALSSLSMPAFWDGLKSATENITETANQFDEAAENDHDTIKSHYVKETHARIRSLIHVTRNVALPFIKDTLASLEQYHLRKSHENAEEAAYKIVQIERSAVADNPLVTELVENFRAAPFETLRWKSAPLDLTADRIGDTLLNGGVMDGLVEECIKDEAAVSLVSNFFNGITVIDGSNSNLAGSILIFLLANALYDNPPDAATGTLATWNANVASLISSAGALASIDLRKENTANRERLYVYPHTGETTIYVNGPFYRKALDDGLTPEMLIGNELMDRRCKDLEDFMPVKDMLERKFASFQARIKERYELNRLKWSVAFTCNALGEFIRSDALEEDRKAASLERLHVVESVAYSEDVNITESDLVNRMVCACIWPDLDVYRMISGIDRIGASHPDMDMRQILTLFMLDYVTDLTVLQTEIVTV